MLIPMMGFFLVLIVIGGLGSLVAIADRTRARLLPFTLAMLFSGTGVYVVMFGMFLTIEKIFGSYSLLQVFFCIGLLVGSIGWAVLGFIAGTRRNRRIIE